MPPHEGLTHLPEYHVEDSNVEFIGTDIDHKVKYASAETEPAWRGVGSSPGLRIWRIEDFQVVPWPSNNYGTFTSGDSFIVLHTYKPAPDSDALAHDIHFWLGRETSQDEAGVAAYKTVELDEFLRGVAVQYREVQGLESARFLQLFPRLTLRRGGVASGFKHVNTEEKDIFRLYQILTAGTKYGRAALHAPPKKAGAAPRGSGISGAIVVQEVEPVVASLNSGDVFVLDEGKKLRAWQGAQCSPMEKAKAAQVLHQLNSERESQAETEVLAQSDSRALAFINALGGDINTVIPSPSSSSSSPLAASGPEPERRPVRLFRLSDAQGTLNFDMVKNGEPVRRDDFRSEDVFIYDTANTIFVWQGRAASAAEKQAWLRVAEAYVRTLDAPVRARVGLCKVREGHEGPSFGAALAVAAA
ncbi:hypothetical protein OC834_003874 [Tilletia horrida]|uniref:Gelsolin-like domain-containing protein n=1 Tax=Tilletia horrida TaxID=155126 RepID=A0AAN6GEF5_9BASI|nr:hypothetical protein OC834_003874 [Tilletia horrida]KAK0536216.1 hypothetical protein OC842_002045 [Tilletia horrida]